MTEGTKSYLFGCHQFLIHPLCVLWAWRKWFGTWPKFWQIVCIFLHDIGICGRQYLSNKEAKNGHWIEGAYWAKRLFGWKGFYFCAGHTPESKDCLIGRSQLWYADKYSWVVAPMWWLWNNFRIEKFQVTHPWEWKILIAENLKKDLFGNNHFSSHKLYQDNFNKPNPQPTG